jgi:hypothetical protein
MPLEQYRQVSILGDESVSLSSSLMGRLQPLTSALRMVGSMRSMLPTLPAIILLSPSGCQMALRPCAVCLGVRETLAVTAPNLLRPPLYSAQSRRRKNSPQRELAAARIRGSDPPDCLAATSVNANRQRQRVHRGSRLGGVAAGRAFLYKAKIRRQPCSCRSRRAVCQDAWSRDHPERADAGAGGAGTYSLPSIARLHSK